MKRFNSSSTHPELNVTKPHCSMRAWCLPAIAGASGSLKFAYRIRELSLPPQYMSKVSSQHLLILHGHRSIRQATQRFTCAILGILILLSGCIVRCAQLCMYLPVLRSTVLSLPQEMERSLSARLRQVFRAKEHSWRMPLRKGTHSSSVGRERLVVLLLLSKRVRKAKPCWRERTGACTTKPAPCRIELSRGKVLASSGVSG